MLLVLHFDAFLSPQMLSFGGSLIKIRLSSLGAVVIDTLFLFGKIKRRCHLRGHGQPNVFLMAKFWNPGIFYAIHNI
jgi:hypothetical protein